MMKMSGKNGNGSNGNGQKAASRTSFQVKMPPVKVDYGKYGIGGSRATNNGYGGTDSRTPTHRV